MEEEQPACHISEQAMEAGEDGPSSMPNVDEELVDYGDDEEDVEDNVPQDSQPLVLRSFLTIGLILPRLHPMRYMLLTLMHSIELWGGECCSRVRL